MGPQPGVWVELPVPLSRAPVAWILQVTITTRLPAPKSSPCSALQAWPMQGLWVPGGSTSTAPDVYLGLTCPCSCLAKLTSLPQEGGPTLPTPGLPAKKWLC